MDTANVETDERRLALSHDELSLLLFALQGGAAAALPAADSCEEACPVVESFEELLCGGELEPRQRLIRHLNNHVREALIDCGMFELMADSRDGNIQTVGDERQARFDIANQRLKRWSSEINLSASERQLLAVTLSHMPRSAWLVMPRTLWKLRRKLR